MSGDRKKYRLYIQHGARLYKYHVRRKIPHGYDTLFEASAAAARVWSERPESQLAVLDFTDGNGHIVAINYPRNWKKSK